MHACLFSGEEPPVRNCTIRKLPRVSEGMPLYDFLNEFQKGHSHMAVVVKSKYNRPMEKSQFPQHDRELKLDRRKAVKKPTSPRDHKCTRPYRFLALDMPGKRETNTEDSTAAADAERTTLEGVPEQEGSVVAATFVRPPPLQQQQQQQEAGFNEPGPQGRLQEQQEQRNKKWERSPADNVLDVEERLAATPSFDSPDEVVTGLITMEDVIEELLQKEILDETDEYVDLHARIKVNLLPSEGKGAPAQ